MASWRSAAVNSAVGGAASRLWARSWSIGAPVTLGAAPYSSQNSSRMAVRIARSTAHCAPAEEVTIRRTDIVHGVPTVLGGVTSTAGWTTSSSRTSSRISSRRSARVAAASARSIASSVEWELRSGIGMVTTARDQYCEEFTQTFGVEFGMVIVSWASVRILVARRVMEMTVPSTSTPEPSKRTQSLMPYCFSVRMKNPARKSAMMLWAPRPRAAETTVAGMAAPASEKPRVLRKNTISRK